MYNYIYVESNEMFDNMTIKRTLEWDVGAVYMIYFSSVEFRIPNDSIFTEGGKSNWLGHLPPNLPGNCKSFNNREELFLL